MNPYALSDLDEVVDRVDWKPLHGMHLEVTGGTGFIGTWMLRTLRRAIVRGAVKTGNVEVATRQDMKEVEGFPTFRTDLCENDAIGMPIIPTHVLHLAVTGAAKRAEFEAGDGFRDITLPQVKMATDIAAYAHHYGAHVVFASSGAVHGETAYGVGKRIAEQILEQVGAASLRLYAVGGPGVPDGYAWSDVAEGKPVRDPGVVRSWLYPTDVCVAFWRALASRKKMTLEVGSTEAATIGQLEALFHGKDEGRYTGGVRPGMYLPPCGHGAFSVPLAEAVRRTKEWGAGP